MINEDFFYFNRCRITECNEHEKLQKYDPDWILNVVPKTSSGFASCERYVYLRLNTKGTLDSCPASLFNQSGTTSCDSYVYLKDNSVVYDVSEACQKNMRFKIYIHILVCTDSCKIVLDISLETIKIF